MKIPSEQIQEIALSIDKLDYVICRMFPNIVGGHHYMAQGELDQSTMQQAERSIITYWAVQGQEVQTPEKIMEVWQIVAPHYNRMKDEIYVQNTFAEPLVADSNDLQNDPLDSVDEENIEE